MNQIEEEVGADECRFCLREGGNDVSVELINRE
jgi:hypothetical protein